MIRLPAGGDTCLTSPDRIGSRSRFPSRLPGVNLAPMPAHNFQPPQGELKLIEIDSRALRGNLLGDPSRRSVAVYQSPGDQHGEMPLLVYLASFTGSGLKKLSWQMFGESIPQRIDRLVAQRVLGPVVVAFPDCFTSLGGNQYLNSPVMGSWEDFLLRELIPRLEDDFPVRPGPAHRAVLGFSSGGYGALVQALRHGGEWGAVACHSADLGFEISLRGDFPKVVTRLARCDGDPQAFVEAFWEAPQVLGDDLHVLMFLALAASYDPDPSLWKGIRLPVDPKTCELDPQRWQRWLAHDPLAMLERAECQANLRRLKGFYFDCGAADQYHLQYGSRILARRLRDLGIDHVFEEFEGGHGGVEHRLDVSLPFLYRKIAPAC